VVLKQLLTSLMKKSLMLMMMETHLLSEQL